MIELVSLKATNFRSWKELELTNLNNRGLCLIHGDNGSGKSGIRQIIEYLLIDTTSDGIPVNDLPRDNDSQCMMQGVFDRDGDTIEIIKYRNHKKEKNRIILSINGEDSLTHTDRRDTQREIEKLFGITKYSLLVSTIFSGNSPSFPESEEVDRKKVVYDALDLTKYENEYHARAKTKCSEIEISIETREKHIDDLTNTLVGIDKDSEVLDEKIKSFKQEQKEKITNLLTEKENLVEESTEQLEKEIAGLEKRLIIINIVDYEKLKEDRDNLLKRTINININIETIKNKLKEAGNDNHTILISRLKELEHKLITIDIKFPISLLKELKERQEKLKGEGYKLKHAIESATTSIGEAGTGICPVLKDECDTLVVRRDEILEKYEPELVKLKEQYEAIVVELSECGNSVVTEEERILNNKAIKEEIESVTSKINIIEEYEPQLKELEKDYKTYSSVLDEDNILIKEKEEQLNINIKIESEVKDIENEVKIIKNDTNNITIKKVELDVRIREIKDEPNPYAGLKHNLHTKAIILQSDLTETKEKLSSLIDDFKYYEYWKIGYSKQGLPNMKADGFLGSIETEVNESLSLIGEQIYVEIGSQSELGNKEIREKISYKIHKPNKKVRDFKSYSGGEKHRVKLADMFAFKELIGKLNMVLLDEVLELSLDSKGKDRVIELLRDRINTIGSIFVISHSDQIKDKFDTVLHIENVNGISKLKI